MTWNFCPWCSHRIYQHSDKGCEYSEIGVVIDGVFRPYEKPTTCDCKRPHALLAEGSIAG